MYAHLKNRRALILHEGLILLIMEHVKALILAPTIKGKEKFVQSPRWRRRRNGIRMRRMLHL